MGIKEDSPGVPGKLPRPVEILSHDGAIVLKQLIPQDAEELFALIDRNREHLSQHGDDTAAKYPTLESVSDSIVTPKNPHRMRFAIRNAQGEVVGSINLTPDKDTSERGEIGYYLGSEFQGKGYAGRAVERLTEYAFQELGYETLFGEVAEGNNPSVKVLEGTGYRETGRNEGKIIFSKRK